MVGVGNALVDYTYLLTNLPDADSGAYVLDRDTRPGGVESNVMAALGVLDIDTGLIARLGDDADADMVVAHLDAAGIETRRVRRATGDITSYCIVLTDEDGRRAILGGGDSTPNLELDTDDLAYLNGAKMVFSSAYAPARVVRRLADIDTSLAFDLAGGFDDIKYRGFTRQALDEVLSGIDLLISNVNAAQSYLRREHNPQALAVALRERGVYRGAVTAGADGSVLFDRDDTYTIEALNTDVVDTTGAGDVFTAALIKWWLLDGESPAEAGRYATAAAALSCTSRGARGALPTREEVLERLQ